MDMEFLIYGTRSSKDKSGAYLFLPDGEAKVPYRHLANPSRPWRPQERRAGRRARAFVQGDPACQGASPALPLRRVGD